MHARITGKVVFVYRVIKFRVVQRIEIEVSFSSRKYNMSEIKKIFNFN